MDVVGFVVGAVITAALGIFIIFNAISIFKELFRLKQKKSIKEDEKNDNN